MADLPRNTKVIIELSLSILRSAMARASDGNVATVEVRLALRCLRPHCPEQWPLTQFWEGATSIVPTGRPQTVTAAFNGICRQLRLAGRYPDAETAP